jgi:hypothetical protein
VPVQLAHEFAAVLMTEVERNIALVEFATFQAYQPK